jgi:hypothetical protein
MSDALIKLIKQEYEAMPGLCLTTAQASRLWQIDKTTCESVLARLVSERILRRTPRGAYAPNDPLRTPDPGRCS